MITADDAKALSEKNLSIITEHNVKQANKFITARIEPLIINACKNGIFDIEKEFEENELFDYDIPTIKSEIEKNRYKCTWKNTKCINSAYIKFTISWN